MRTMKKQTLAIFAAAALLLPVSCIKGPAGPEGPAAAAGVSIANLQDGVYPSPAYTGTTDACISSVNPSVNYGACDTAAAGTSGGGPSRYLLKFDTTDLLPPSITAVKFYLRLYVAQVSGSVTIRAYRAAKAWDEGAGSCAGAAGTAGGATWYNASSVTAWAVPGAIMTRRP